MRLSRQRSLTSAAGPRRPGAFRHARRQRLTPLARDIVVILVAKAILLGLLWFAFFRAPAAPHGQMDPQRVEQRVLAPTPTPGIPHAVR